MSILEKQRLLTLSFDQQRQFPLVETGANFLKSMVTRRSTEKRRSLLLLDLKHIKHKVSWEQITGTFSHSCTLNMDPSMIGYSNELKYQELVIMKLVDEIRSYIKNIVVIYEYGKNRKLHWHILMHCNNTRDIQHLFQMQFGKRYGVICKRITPNPGESKKQNVHRMLEYLKKEEHNKTNAYLAMVKIKQN